MPPPNTVRFKDAEEHDKEPKARMLAWRGIKGSRYAEHPLPPVKLDGPDSLVWYESSLTTVKDLILAKEASLPDLRFSHVD